MTKFVVLRPKTYNYSIDDVSENRKAKCTKSVSKKENVSLKIIEITQLENKINYLEKNKINIDSFKKS